MDGAQGHLLKHTLTNDGPNPLESSIHNELTRQLRLDKDKQHRSFSWKLLRKGNLSLALSLAVCVCARVRVCTCVFVGVCVCLCVCVCACLKSVFHATQYQGDTALTIPPFFKNARRGAERIWGEKIVSPQPMVINWPSLTEEEKKELVPTLSTTDNWILLTHHLELKINPAKMAAEIHFCRG